MERDFSANRIAVICCQRLNENAVMWKKYTCKKVPKGYMNGVFYEKPIGSELDEQPNLIV